MFRRECIRHLTFTSAAATERLSQDCTPNRRDDMSKKTGWLGAGFAATALIVALASAGAGPAEAAVVYCKTAGVPQGCVVRPTVPVVPVAAATTAVGVTAVRATRVRVANVGIGARGVGVRPGTPLNRGGPVNRIGRR
jgi:hypothetical protein